MVNDFFLQATIDFLLGNVTSMVFEEFEANMMTKDPAVSMQKMREQAIELSQKRVVADEAEEFVGGWTLLAPRVPRAGPDSARAAAAALAAAPVTGPLEEVVLLLTDAALYLCRFDWNLDKVSSFERVELAHVEGIRFGAYITATNTPAQTDENRNVGFVVSYSPGSRDITRVNTRSLSSATTDLGNRAAAAGRGKGAGVGGLASILTRRITNEPANPPPPRKLALKALSASSSIAVQGAAGSAEAEGTAQLTEIQQVVSICADIERLALRAQQESPFAAKRRADEPEQGEGGKTSLIEKGDIISLEEARKSTGLLEQLGHSIKRMVWA